MFVCAGTLKANRKDIGRLSEEYKYKIEIQVTEHLIPGLNWTNWKNNINF